MVFFAFCSSFFAVLKWVESIPVVLFTHNLKYVRKVSQTKMFKNGTYQCGYVEKVQKNQALQCNSTSSR